MNSSRAFFNTVMQVMSNLKNEFKIENPDDENHVELYSRLKREQERIFHHLELSMVVAKANSPSGISVAELGMMAGEGAKNPLMALIQQPVSYTSRINEYQRRCLDLQMSFQYERTATLAKSMFADVMTSSTAETIFPVKEVNTPLHHNKQEIEKSEAERKEIVDILIKAMIATNAVTTFKLMLKRQLALAKDSLQVYRYFTDLLISSNQPDLLIALIESGMATSIELIIDDKRVSLLSAIICDYNDFIIEMTGSLNAAQNTEELKDKMPPCIRKCMVEKANNTNRVMAYLLAKNIKCEEISEMVRQSMQCVGDAILSCQSTMSEYLMPYSSFQIAMQEQQADNRKIM